jgi:ribosomal protein S8
MLKKREEKLKYARFAIHLNRAIGRKQDRLEVESFMDLPHILRILVQKGFIRGFEQNDNKVLIFFKFGPKHGNQLLKKIELLTKTSLRAYKDLYHLRKFDFHNQSFYGRLFVISTNHGLIVTDNLSALSVGGELIYKIN